jgi:hypothetical protein
MAVALVAAGCGEDMVADDAGVARDAGSDAGPVAMDGGARDGGTDAGAADAGPGDDAGLADAGLADAGSEDAGSLDAGALDAGPTIDASATSISLTGAAVYSNCMPSVPPDPILAFWTVHVSGAPGGLTSVTLTDAKLTITPASGAPVNQTLTIDFPAVALTGGAGTQDQRKTGADVLPSGACSALCSGATFSLELTYDVAGTPFVVTETGAFGCVY